MAAFANPGTVSNRSLEHVQVKSRRDTHDHAHNHVKSETSERDIVLVGSTMYRSGFSDSQHWDCIIQTIKGKY